MPIDDLQDSFTKTTNKVVEIVKNKDLNVTIRNDKIIDTITPMFDFKLMAKLSLGKRWKRLTKAEQKLFVELYVKRMKKSYSSKLDKYTNEKIIIDDIKQIKKNRAVLTTNLINIDDKLEIIYKFYKPRKRIKNKDIWLVYDVVIAGISIIKTDKAQFKAVLQNSSIQELLEKLN
jgi:phospholipid transport system substrate-binding protein